MRISLALLVLAAALGGAASAATIVGAVPGQALRGTPRADLIVVQRGPAVVDARGGADRVATQYNGARDRVRCGPGRDVVTADRNDVVARDCEVVSRLISRDPTTADGQHETQAEPHAAAAGRTIVATFQSGRRHGGGANDIGFSTSRDGGRTWRGGHLPAVAVNSRPAGTAPYASDPVVAYDAEHGVWQISTLAVSPGLTELYISRSRDGLRWDRPVVAARAAVSRLAYDKNWIACDNWPQSPRRGRCYLAYTDHQAGSPRIAVQTSDDGGATWSAPAVAVRASGQAVGVLVAPRPDGSVVFPYLGEGTIVSVRSPDGGQTFEPPVTIARYQHRPVPALRAFPLPTADVDARGRVYVAWQDCRSRAECAVNDVVLSTSGDGVAWSTPARVTRDGGSDFMPALAVDAASGRVALAYHRCTGVPCRTDVLVMTSPNGGGTWSRPQRLNTQPMLLSWIPTTVSGRMLGDYIGLVWSSGRPVTVYALASPPRGVRLRQATAAARLP